MQDEREEKVEDTEEVEAHKTFGPEKTFEPSGEPSARSDEEDEDEVQAHKTFGPEKTFKPEEFGKQF